MNLETEKDLDDEHMSRVHVSSLFSFNLFSRDNFPEKISQIESSVEEQRLRAEYHPQGQRLSRVTMNQIRQRFCVQDEEVWAQHATLWHTIGKA